MQKTSDIFNTISLYLEEMDKRHWKRAKKVSSKTNTSAEKKRKGYSKKLEAFKIKIANTGDPKEKEALEFMLRQYILKRRKNS